MNLIIDQVVVVVYGEPLSQHRRRPGILSQSHGSPRPDSSRKNSFLLKAVSLGLLCLTITRPQILAGVPHIKFKILVHN